MLEVAFYISDINGGGESIEHDATVQVSCVGIVHQCGLQRDFSPLYSIHL